MPTYKPYTDVSSLPTNSGGERTILEAHLDAAHGTIADVIEYLTQSVFSDGGVVVAGTVTNPEAAVVRVQGRLGVTSDCKTVLAVSDATVDLAAVATGTRCLIVIRAQAGATTDHTFTDPATGEVLVHTLLSRWGHLAAIEGDASNYPALPADCVPVVRVTKTGAASLSLDSVITTEPTTRYGGGGGDTSGLLPKLAEVNSHAGNHTLDAADSGAYVRITAAGTVTLPDGLATGFQCLIVNATDLFPVALAAETSLTLPAGFEAEIQNRRAVTVIHVGGNEWEVHGALVETP